ncbi:hypothetical protein [Halapricum desulfuricans]|uniref:Uncharacterized protein n=1 Tax=Halapricum desulfuricans TaxID=2841257 RepID=A0A897N8A7_9EURY|nr:hypothetical protein [Halapricum desulfuricans]QSG07403.1 hypothetical protein HSR121_3094 [Halapricum desulfuricans]
MPSWEGFNTWFNYQFYMVTAVLVAAVLVWTGRLFLDVIDVRNVSVEVAIAVWIALTVVALGLVRWIND